MNSRLSDMLILVSRVHEKRGDLRPLLHEDPRVRGEVHSYLDDLSWLSHLPPLQPGRLQAGAGKAQLMAMLRDRDRKRRRWLPWRMFATTFGAIMVLGLVLAVELATYKMPASLQQTVADVIYSSGHQAKSLPAEQPAPPESGLEASAAP